MTQPAAQGAASSARPDLGVNQEGARRDQFLPVSTLAVQARKVAQDMGLSIGGSRARALVRQYVSTGRSDIDFRTWFIAYADPTGEAAVRRTMKTRGY